MQLTLTLAQCHRHSWKKSTKTIRQATEEATTTTIAAAVTTTTMTSTTSSTLTHSSSASIHTSLYRCMHKHDWVNAHEIKFFYMGYEDEIS